MPEIWPFCPVDCTEAVSFYTDLLPAYSAEQRIALRYKPRQGLAMRVEFETRQQLGRADALFRSNAGGEWYVPYWPDALAVGDLSSGATSIAATTANRDYRTRILVWEGETVNETVAVSSIGGSSISLSAGLSQDYSDAYIVPVLTGYSLEGLQVQRGEFAVADISFEVRDVKDLGATSYPTYLSADVLTDRSYVVSELSEGVSFPSVAVDSGLGRVVVERSINYLIGRASIMFEDEAADRWTRRTWLWSLRGRQKAFWLPTWNQDLTINSDIGSSDTAISVVNVAGLSSADDRHIMIQKTDGTRYYRQITAAGSGTITINSALGAAVAAADIEVCCYLNLSRLDTDTIQFDHRGTNFTRVSLPTVEVPA